MKRIALFLILFTFNVIAEAQQFSVSGSIFDKGTNDDVEEPGGAVERE